MKLYGFSFDGGHHGPVIIVLATSLKEARKLAIAELGGVRGLKHETVQDVDKSAVVHCEWGEC